MAIEGINNAAAVASKALKDLGNKLFPTEQQLVEKAMEEQLKEFDVVIRPENLEIIPQINGQTGEKTFVIWDKSKDQLDPSLPAGSVVRQSERYRIKESAIEPFPYFNRLGRIGVRAVADGGEKIAFAYPDRPSSYPAPIPAAEVLKTAPKKLHVETTKTLIGKPDRPEVDGEGGGDKIFPIRSGIVLIDGMGGQGSDAQAAKLFGEAAQKSFNESAPNLVNDLTDADIVQLKNAMLKAMKEGAVKLVENQLTRTIASSADVVANIVAMFRSGGKTFVASVNIGDASTYIAHRNPNLHQGQYLEQISAEHSLVTKFSDEQKYTDPVALQLRNRTRGASELSKLPLRNKDPNVSTVETRTSGVVIREVDDGDFVLVASDGFGDNANPTDTREWLKRLIDNGEPPRVIQHRIIEEAHAVSQSSKLHAKPDDFSIASLEPILRN